MKFDLMTEIDRHPDPETLYRLIQRLLDTLPAPPPFPPHPRDAASAGAVLATVSPEERVTLGPKTLASISPENAPENAPIPPDPPLAICSKPLSFTSPRGRFTLAICRTQLLLTDAKNNQISIPLAGAKLSRVFLLHQGAIDPPNRTHVYLHLASPVTVGKQQIRAVVCHATPADKVTFGDKIVSTATPAFEALPEALVALELISLNRIHTPDPTIFRPTTSKKLSLTCNLITTNGRGGIRDGQIFFLKGGMCFLPAPATFLARHDIKRAEIQRASASSPTFSLLVRMKDGSHYEIGQMGGTDLPGVATWLQEAGIRQGPTQDEDEEEDESESKSESENVSEPQDGKKGVKRGRTMEDGEDGDEDFDVEREKKRERCGVGGGAAPDDENDKKEVIREEDGSDGEFKAG